MILTFVAPSLRHPVGGVAVIYELADAMARRGHRCHVFHVPMFGPPLAGPEDIGWFEFADGVEHHFVVEEPLAPEEIPAADVIFGFSSQEEMPAHVGLPVVLIQGYQMLSDDQERHAFHAPCPKVCVAGWLVEVGVGFGVPAGEFVHIPPGVRHDRFHLQAPIADRPPVVSFCYNPHRQKRAQLAVDVLTDVRAEVPDVEVVAFGARLPDQPLPPWIRFEVDPPQRRLVDIYNSSRVFLCTSDVEGFGLPCVEAMACGAVLVTTDNGGSRDYADDGRTALVAPTGDRAGLAAHVTRLLGDDAGRAALAAAGVERAARFDWARSAELLEDFVGRYVADPAAYGFRGTR